MRTLVAASSSLVCLFSQASLLFVFGGAVAMGDEPADRVVQWCDIPSKVKVIGRFRAPLGEEVVVIRGKWQAKPEVVKPYYDPAKTSEFVFAVTSLNGKLLDVPIEIPWNQVEPFKPRGVAEVVSDTERKWTASSWTIGGPFPEAFEGDEWEMTGFEAGKTVGDPRKVREMYKGEQRVFAPGTFVVSFRVLIVRSFGKLHDENEVGGFTIGGDN